MKVVAPLLTMLLVAGCSSQLLEEPIDTGEFNAPRPCNEPMKLFNTFSVYAKRISWKTTPGNSVPTLTVDLVVNNDKSWPIALSNSMQGVLYSVNFILRGEKGNFTAKEKAGIFLTRDAREFKEPKRAGPFAKPPKSSSLKGTTAPRGKKVDDTIRDVNFRIRPDTPEAGALAFEAPRDRYLLVIERKFTNQPASAQAKDDVAVCKISPVDISSQSGANPAAKQAG